MLLMVIIKIFSLMSRLHYMEVILIILSFYILKTINSNIVKMLNDIIHVYAPYYNVLYNFLVQNRKLEFKKLCNISDIIYIKTKIYT